MAFNLFRLLATTGITSSSFALRSSQLLEDKESLDTSSFQSAKKTRTKKTSFQFAKTKTKKIPRSSFKVTAADRSILTIAYAGVSGMFATLLGFFSSLLFLLVRNSLFLLSDAHGYQNFVKRQIDAPFAAFQDGMLRSPWILVRLSASTTFRLFELLLRLVEPLRLKKFLLKETQLSETEAANAVVAGVGLCLLVIGVGGYFALQNGKNAWRFLFPKKANEEEFYPFHDSTLLEVDTVQLRKLDKSNLTRKSLRKLDKRARKTGSSYDDGYTRGVTQNILHHNLMNQKVLDHNLINQKESPIIPPEVTIMPEVNLMEKAIEPETIKLLNPKTEDVVESATEKAPEVAIEKMNETLTTEAPALTKWAPAQLGERESLLSESERAQTLETLHATIVRKIANNTEAPALTR